MTAAAPASRPMPGRIEFVAMMSMLMGMVALGIDAMLPALDDMATDLGVTGGSASVAGVVTTYLLGLAVGQMLWGPLADRFGRKFVLNAGLGVLALGAIASAATTTLPVLLATRVLWGLGSAAARSTTMTIVRDRYVGDRMASIMSLIMSVFILVPVVAPSIGAGVLVLTSWRGMFVGLAVLAMGQLLWLRRLPETLRPEHVRSIAPRVVLGNIRLVVTNRVTLGYTLALTALSAAFTPYLALSEPIIAGLYGLEDEFPVLFGLFALGMAFASLANSRVVERVGARRLVRFVTAVYTVIASVLVLLTLLAGGLPSIWVFAIALVSLLMSHAFMQSNIQSLAMDPMGSVAGMASAVVGSLSLGAGTVIGTVVQVFFDDTITPVVVGFAVSGVVAIAMVWLADRTRPDRSEVTATEVVLPAVR